MRIRYLARYDIIHPSGNSRVDGADGQLRRIYRFRRKCVDCPTNALTWLVNELSAQNVRYGQVCDNGTTTLPMAILPGDQIEADFYIGRISRQLSAEKIDKKMFFYRSSYSIKIMLRESISKEGE